MHSYPCGPVRATTACERSIACAQPCFGPVPHRFSCSGGRLPLVVLRSTSCRPAQLQGSCTGMSTTGQPSPHHLTRLSLHVLGNATHAALATLLFALNPASIFFTAPYTEPTFAMLSMAGMLCWVRARQQHVIWLAAAAVLFAAATATRSNGAHKGVVLNARTRDSRPYCLCCMTNTSQASCTVAFLPTPHCTAWWRPCKHIAPGHLQHAPWPSVLRVVQPSSRR